MDIRRLNQFSPWIALNLFGVVVLALVLRSGSSESTSWTAPVSFHTGLESAKWAVRFLFVCLSMSPLRTYAGWRTAIKLRKSAGLWSLAFAVVHVYLYIEDSGWHWLDTDISRFLFMGLLGFVILIALGITSNRLAMRRLKRNWKRIHRLVYIAGASIVYHAILATSHSKRLYLWDPDAVHEINAYIGILTVLLLIRVPAVRSRLVRLRRVRRVHRPRETAAMDPSPARPLVSPVWSLPSEAWITEGEAGSDCMPLGKEGEIAQARAAPIRSIPLAAPGLIGGSGKSRSSRGLAGPDAGEAEIAPAPGLPPDTRGLPHAARGRPRPAPTAKLPEGSRRPGQ